MKLYSATDVDRDALTGRRIAVLGYGSQGRAQAQNLHDSGLDVVVGLRPGSASRKIAREDGLAVADPADAVRDAALIAFMTPDQVQGALYRELESELAPGTTLLFAHGFTVHYRQIVPRADLDAVLVAPKGPGNLVREQYLAGRGIGCLVAVAQDADGQALRRALAYADAIGGSHAGMLETTFAEETETDLFGEQAVLCGGAAELVLAGYETLVDAGYQPEVAYYECLHELKLVVDLLHDGGLARMHRFISDTAAWGGLVSGPRVIDEHARARMQAVLERIRSGEFAREWIAENDAGLGEFSARRQRHLDHPVEDVGRRVRRRMEWLPGPDD